MEEIILSLVSSLIYSCGDSITKKLWLKLNSYRITKRIKRDIQNRILNKYGNERFYNDFDVFITAQDFSNNLISYCTNYKKSDIESIDKYIRYLVIKFSKAHPQHRLYMSKIQEILYMLFEIAYSNINDITKNETARLISTELNEKSNQINNKLDLILQQHEVILAQPKEHTNLNILDCKGKIIEYKSSLFQHYAIGTQYICRNIFTEDDFEKTSMESLLENKRILLLGEPGCGKTYEALNLFQEFCTESNYENYIPIYLKLIEYGVAYDDIIDGITKKLSPFFIGIDREDIIRVLNSNRLILILDGIDEIWKTENRIKFYGDVNNILSFSQANCFITSRENQYHNEIANIKEFFIKGIDKNKIDEILKENNIIAELSETSYEIFANPLFLQIGIKVLKNIKRGNLYNKSHLFYSYVYDVCYNRDIKKGLNYQSRNQYDILMLIGKLAYEKFEKPYFTTDEFDEFFNKEKSDYSVYNISDFFRIDVFKIGENICFTHKQFKEYFAAYFLAKNYKIAENKGLYQSLMKKEHWQEVLLFVAGIIDNMEEQDQFLNMLLKTNLRTYIKCLKNKNNLSEYLNGLSIEEYAKWYLSSLFKSFNLIVDTYFPHIHMLFEPYASKTKDALIDKKRCIVGSMSLDRKYLHYWFDWKHIDEDDVKIINDSDINTFYTDMERRAVIEQRRITSHCINLEFSALVGNTARDVAVDLIYRNITECLKKYQLIESGYISYEKFGVLVNKIKSLKGKSIEEIALWTDKQIKNTYESLKDCDEIVGVHHNGVDIIYLNQLSKYLLSKNGTHESLSLPPPDKSASSGGYIWDVYSKERTMERIRKFFWFRQLSYEEMITTNFPKMRKYFSLAQDSPYKYKVIVNFKNTTDYTSDPSMTYYRVSIKQGEPNIPEVIECCDEFFPFNENYINEMFNSFHQNGKELKNSSICSTSFSMTLIEHSSGNSTPLTSKVYRDFKKEFEGLFEYRYV